MKTLTKEKKEKENVLTYLELINLKNVFLLKFEKIKRKTSEAIFFLNGSQEKVLEEFVAHASTIGNGIKIVEKFGSN